MRVRGKLAKVVPECCGSVWDVVRTQQIKGAGRHVAIYLDGEINLEVGVELDTPFAGSGQVVGSVIPAGMVGTTVHFGPHGQLYRAHQAIHNWCKEHGYALAGPNWEIYGHWVDAWNSDPSLIRTDVFYLLKAGGGRGSVRILSGASDSPVISFASRRNELATTWP